MLKESLATAFLHYNHANNHHKDVQNIVIDKDNFRDKEVVKTIDAFIFRFLKLQDFMGNKLFKDLLDSMGAYQDNMTPIDMADKLEKINLIDSSNQWMAFRQVRNQLTHEYPDNTDDVIEGIYKAIKIFQEIEKILKRIKDYIDQKALLDFSKNS